MSSLKIFISVFLTIIISSIPNQISRGCGPIDFSFKGYNFFETNLVKTGSPFTDYILRFDDFYQNYEVSDSVRNTSNLQEWNKIFCDEFYEDEIKEVVYGKVENIEAIQQASEKKKKKLGLRLNRNSFAKHLVDLSLIHI